MNIKCHVKLKRNTSATELMQQEKTLVFSLIKENTMPKNLRITLALTTQKVRDFLIWIPQMLAFKKHPVSLIDGVVFLHQHLSYFIISSLHMSPGGEEEDAKRLLSLLTLTQRPKINAALKIIHT